MRRNSNSVFPVAFWKHDSKDTQKNIYSLSWVKFGEGKEKNLFFLPPSNAPKHVESLPTHFRFHMDSLPKLHCQAGFTHQSLWCYSWWSWPWMFCIEKNKESENVPHGQIKIDCIDSGNIPLNMPVSPNNVFLKCCVNFKAPNRF